MTTNQHMSEFPAEPRQPYAGHPYPPPQLPPQIIIQNTANAAAAASGAVPKRTNHVLHFIATLCTGGLWLPVWLWIAHRNRNAGQAYARAGR